MPRKRARHGAVLKVAQPVAAHVISVSGGAVITQDAARRAAEIGKELETVYARWEELEARR